MSDQDQEGNGDADSGISELASEEHQVQSYFENGVRQKGVTGDNDNSDCYPILLCWFWHDGCWIVVRCCAGKSSIVSVTLKNKIFWEEFMLLGQC